MWRDQLEQGRAALEDLEPEADLWHQALEKTGTHATEHRSLGARRIPRVLVTAAVLTFGAIGFLVVIADDDPRVRTTSASVDPEGHPREPEDAAEGQHGQPAVAVRGEAVRGADVPLVIDGLHRFQGQRVYLRLETDGPVRTVSGGDRVGYASLASAVVDDGGSLSARVTIPNSLSGEDDIIPLVPGRRYMLIVQGADDRVDIPFTVAEAVLDTRYTVTARRGSPECGGPPVEVGFDGRQWSPESPALLQGSEEQVTGFFKLVSEESARFERPGHPPATFSAAVTGWSC